jgi:hypothetical protein
VFRRIIDFGQQKQHAMGDSRTLSFSIRWHYSATECFRPQHFVNWPVVYSNLLTSSYPFKHQINKHCRRRKKWIRTLSMQFKNISMRIKMH